MAQCEPCSSPSPFAHDPSPLPLPVLEAAREESRYSKAAFFTLLQTKFQSNYTSRPYRSRHRVIASPHGRPPVACVTGDSIGEEVYRSLSEMLRPVVGAEHRPVFMTRAAGMLTADHILGCERFDTNATSHVPEQLKKQSRGCRQCDIIFVTGTWLHWLYREPPPHNPFGDVKQKPLENDRSRRGTAPVDRHAAYFAGLVDSLERWAQCTRKHLVVVGSGEMDVETFLSAPASHNWFRFYPNDVSRYWRQREREVFSKHPTRWVRYLDAGALHRRYPGVRCDGVHFFSWHDSSSPRELDPSVVEVDAYECHPSAGLWDGLVLDALEAAGLVRRCGCTTWHLQPPTPHAST